MKLFILLILLVCVCSIQAFFLQWLKDVFLGSGEKESEEVQHEQPAWDGLRTHFGYDTSSPQVFESMPRTVEDALDQGWERDPSVSCDSRRSRVYEGDRYLKDGDPGAMLLFDKNGFIAGIQVGIPKSSDPKEYPNTINRIHHVFNEEPNMMVATAYFVEPSTICSEGRSISSFRRDGTGNMFAFQIGPTSESLMRIPMEESQVEKATQFTFGACYPQMGSHYWYRYNEAISLQDQDCGTLFAAFLLYNKGKLNGIGWGWGPNYDNSWRWEHWPVSVLDKTMGKRFKCLDGSAMFSGLHTYLDNEPQDIVCPVSADEENEN